MTDDDRISRLADKFQTKSPEELLASEEFRQLSEDDAAALTAEFDRRAAAETEEFRTGRQHGRA
jgi:hypothetical protein